MEEHIKLQPIDITAIKQGDRGSAEHLHWV